MHIQNVHMSVHAHTERTYVCTCVRAYVSGLVPFYSTEIVCQKQAHFETTENNLTASHGMNISREWGGGHIMQLS
jgi:hypothetical protein